MGACVFKIKKKFLINYKTRSQIYFMSQLSNCKIISIVVTFIFLYLKASMDLQHLSTKYYRDTYMGFHSDHSSQHRQELLSSE